MLNMFTPTVPEEMIQFDYIIYFKWVGEQAPTSFLFSPQALGLHDFMGNETLKPEEGQMKDAFWCFHVKVNEMNVTFPSCRSIC